MKKAISFLQILILLSVLPFTVHAHPGNTDSSGGHYEKSTGEYHYHHGYSAHSHNDIDGDGTIDCPYDFVDVTKSSKANTQEQHHSSSSEINSDLAIKKKYSFGDVIRSLWISIIFSIMFCTLSVEFISNILSLLFGEKTTFILSFIIFITLFFVFAVHIFRCTMF